MTAPATELAAFLPTLAAQLLAWTGNTLGPGSRAAAAEAVRELAAGLGLPPERYLDRCESDPDLRQTLIDRLLIRTSWFMREPDTLQALATACKRLPRPAGSNRVTIWSAACASGEEPYSVVMALLEVGLDPLVLATDLSTEARAAVSRAEYRAERLEDLPPGWLYRHFEPGAPGHLRLRPELRARVTVLPHNLAHSCRPPPGWSAFDVILCRNVLLYFLREQAERVLRDLSAYVHDHGLLVLSAAEQPLSWSLSELVSDPELPILRRRSAATRPGDLPAPARPGSPTRASAPPANGPPAAQRLALIREAQRAGDGAGALALARTLAGEQPLLAAGQLALGLLLKSAGHSAEATSVLRRARFLFGDGSWMAPYALAVCLDGAGDRRDAIEAYRQAAVLLELGVPSGLEPPEENEPMLAATALEGCRHRLAVLHGTPVASPSAPSRR